MPWYAVSNHSGHTLSAKSFINLNTYSDYMKKKRAKKSPAKKQPTRKAVKKATIHSSDEKRVYVKVPHTHLKKHMPGKHKHHILPVRKERQHKEFSPGDIVHIDILEIERKALRVLYTILPVLAILSGIIVSLIAGIDLLGMLVLVVLFLALGYNLRMILRKHTDVFKGIDVKLSSPKK